MLTTNSIDRCCTQKLLISVDVLLVLDMAKDLIELMLSQ